MIKIFITAIESNKDGTAVELFKDYTVMYPSKEDLGDDEELAYRLMNKVDEIEEERKNQSNPF